MECWNDGLSKDAAMFEKGIAVIGSTTIDNNITSAGSHRKIGGVTTYSGITYCRHGVATTIVSNIAGNDKEVIAALEKEKMIVCSGHTRHTTHFINEVTQTERRQKIPLRAAPIKTDRLSEILKRVSCIHLGPLHPGDIEPGAIERIKFAKLPVVLDVQGYTRRIKDQSIIAGVSKRLSSELMISNIIKFNAFELETVLNFFDLDISELIKIYNIEECVVTCGEKGGWVQDRKGNVYMYQAPQVESIVDPTGAGDVFMAAYLLARFLNQLNIADACSYAAKISARQVRGRYISQKTIGLEP